MVRTLSAARVRPRRSPPLVLGELWRLDATVVIAAGVTVISLNYGRPPRACPCIKPQSTCAVGWATTFRGFGGGDERSYRSAESEQVASSPRRREKRRGHRYFLRPSNGLSIIVIRALSVFLLALSPLGSDRSWSGLFQPRQSSPATAAFPILVQGRRPHLTFRGLLNVHCGLRPVGLLHRQSDTSVSKAPTVSSPPPSLR